ncbi:hypothetical protein D3C81_1608360 [compost metagenome]
MLFPSAITSSLPVIIAIESSLVAASSAMPTTSPSPSPASTPLLVQVRPTTFATSAALPLRAVSLISRVSLAVTSVRKAVAPAPTGSSTTGTPCRLADLPASSMDSMTYSFSVPIFRTTAADICATSAASSWESAMNGEAPSASSPLAEKLATTMFVML